MQEQLLEKIKQDFNTLTEVIQSLISSKAAIQYRCEKMLMDLHQKYPKKRFSPILTFL